MGLVGMPLPLPFVTRWGHVLGHRFMAHSRQHIDWTRNIGRHAWIRITTLGSVCKGYFMYQGGYVFILPYPEHYANPRLLPPWVG